MPLTTIAIFVILGIIILYIMLYIIFQSIKNYYFKKKYSNNNKSNNNKKLDDIKTQIDELNEFGIITDKTSRIIMKAINNLYTDIEEFEKTQQKNIEEKIKENFKEYETKINSQYHYDYTTKTKTVIDEFNENILICRTLYIPNTIKNLNYYFNYYITKKYHLGQQNFTMLNPMCVEFDSTLFNINRFIPQPNTYRTFGSIHQIFTNHYLKANDAGFYLNTNDAGFFVANDLNYNITIKCYLTKHIKIAEKQLKIENPKTFENKLISNLFTEMRQTIIEAYNELNNLQNKQKELQK